MAMWLHVLYVLAFTALAVVAVGNLIRNMIVLGADSTRPVARGNTSRGESSGLRTPAHPEMLDEQGRVINEPLLVMRSISMDDARERLDAIYRSSPGGESSTIEDEEG